MSHRQIQNTTKYCFYRGYKTGILLYFHAHQVEAQATHAVAFLKLWAIDEGFMGVEVMENDRLNIYLESDGLSKSDQILQYNKSDVSLKLH